MVLKDNKIYILSEKKFDGASNIPVIKINFLDKNINLKNYEVLIFTSKNGVEAIDRLNNEWKNISSYAIGSGTAKAIKEKNGKLVYTAKSSYGDNFAHEIKKRLAGKKVLFLRAKVVTSSLNKILRDSGVILDEMVVYETVCENCDNLNNPQKNSYIIFSSPSTIECFFKCFTWDESYTAIVIGEKTASFMPKKINYHLSLEQTISSCIKLAEKLRDNF